MDPITQQLFLGAAGAGIALPDIGANYEGGYYAGLISHTADGVATHALIVAPAATGASGSGYTITTNLQWKTSTTTTSGTTSLFDGAANTASMSNSTHPAANFCAGLSIGGYSDWYLPALYEIDIAYQNLKPTSGSNDTNWGINAYSVPKRNAVRASDTPGQTSVAAFQSGGSEAFPASYHWSSTEFDSANAWSQLWSSGRLNSATGKDNIFRARAFRKVAV